MMTITKHWLISMVLRLKIWESIIQIGSLKSLKKLILVEKLGIGFERIQFFQREVFFSNGETRDLWKDPLNKMRIIIGFYLRLIFTIWIVDFQINLVVDLGVGRKLCLGNLYLIIMCIHILKKLNEIFWEGKFVCGAKWWMNLMCRRKYFQGQLL